MKKSVHLVDLVKSSTREFTCKNRLRYSRERASQTLEVIQFKFRIHCVEAIRISETDLVHWKYIARKRNADTYFPLFSVVAFNLAFTSSFSTKLETQTAKRHADLRVLLASAVASRPRCGAGPIGR